MWYDDLKIGHDAENRVVSLLTDNAIKIIGRNNDDKYDLKFLLYNAIPFTVEVKFDVMEAATGRVAIELKNTYNNKISGLNVTRANLWCHVLYDSIWITGVEKLKGFIYDNSPCAIVNGGDNNSRMYLYNNYKILPIFSRIDTLKDKLLRNIIIEELQYG
jgi:hypothetical protein